MTQLDLPTIRKMKATLSQMALAFPDYEPEDIQYLDKLLTTRQITEDFVREYFFGKLDTEDQRHLVQCGEICFQNNHSTLAETLIKFVLMMDVLSGEVDGRNKLAKSIIAIITKFELSQFIDIERQSDRIRFYSDTHYFSMNISVIEENNRIKLLKLLHETYVQKILEGSIFEEIIFGKYNNTLALIRTLPKERFHEARWARLFAIPDLKYSSKASHTLFKIDDGPKLYDEMICRNFNILLFPAFGTINYTENKISIINEGNGSITNPKLEIRLNEDILVEQNIWGVIPAGGVAEFELLPQDIRELSSVNPNIKEIVFRLEFEKFGDKKFSFVRSVNTAGIFEWLKSQKNSSTRISNSQELFDVIKGFIKDISHTVQEDDGFTELTNLDDDKKRVLRSEKEIQITLKHWLEPKCREFDIALDREPLSGRGPLDFKFSIGRKIKCIMEIKLWDNQQLEHGVEIQLPTYLIAEKAKFGFYVPIAINSKNHQEKLDKLQKSVDDVNKDGGFNIEIMDIRAWKLESASKTKNVSDKSRY